MVQVKRWVCPFGGEKKEGWGRSVYLAKFPQLPQLDVDLINSPNQSNCPPYLYQEGRRSPTAVSVTGDDHPSSSVYHQQQLQTESIVASDEALARITCQR